jgi:hypothetical protein
MQVVDGAVWPVMGAQAVCLSTASRQALGTVPAAFAQASSACLRACSSVGADCGVPTTAAAQTRTAALAGDAKHRAKAMVLMRLIVRCGLGMVFFFVRRCCG